MAVAFGDTIIDVSHVDENAVAYRIGENQTLVWTDDGVRFRARLVPREAVRIATRSVDRAYLGFLTASAAVVLAFLALLPAEPAPPIDDDEHRALLVKMLELEPEPTESVPRRPSERVHSLESNRSPPGPPHNLQPRPPHLPTGSSKRDRPLWVPGSPAQAIGQLGRNHDPIEAARRAGILGVLGDRTFAGERVFDPEIDDAQLWASTSEEAPAWMESVGDPTTGRPSTGEGLIGWGSYGSTHGLERLHVDEDPELAALVRRTNVYLGQVFVIGDMEEGVVRRLVRAHAPELRSCFDQTNLDLTAELDGDVELSLVRGKVGNVVIDPAFPNDLAACMKRAIRRWKFPAGAHEELSIVTVSLRLSR